MPSVCVNDLSWHVCGQAIAEATKPIRFVLYIELGSERPKLF
jgi:hypothetical protein